jgi:hypothetical protein
VTVARLKVYGSTVTPAPEWGAETRQVRVIVAATSQPAARQALEAAGVGRIPAGMFRDYWSSTGNADELAAATRPGQVLWSNEGGPRDFRELDT